MSTHRFLRVVFLLAMLPTFSSALVPVQAAPPEQLPGVLTVGAVIAGAYLAKATVGDLLDQATGDVKDILNQVDATLSDVINKMGETYGQMLDVTLDKLDAFTRTQLERMYTLVQQLQADLQLGLERINATVLADLRAITDQVRTTLAQVQDLTVVTLQGAVLVLDKAVFNAVFLVAVILLAIGLLVFVRMLYTRRLPSGNLPRTLSLAGMGVYLLVTLVLLLPSTRAYALTESGFGQKVQALSKPQVFEVRPSKLIVGRTRELILIGARMAPDGRLPSVQLAGVDVSAAGGDEILALDITGLDLSGKLGPQTLSLRTADGQSVSAAVEIRQPYPIPYVSDWSITPVGKVWVKADVSRSVGCRASPGGLVSTGSCSFNEIIRLQQGYEVDPDHPGQLGSSSNGTLGNAGGGAYYGFTEVITTFTSRHGSPSDPSRLIDFARIAGTPVGIQVSGGARSDTTPNGGKRGEIEATYTVYGRRKSDQDVSGTVWNFHGHCVVSGAVDCGSYPDPGQLSQFVGGPRFIAQVTFVDGDGNTIAASGTLIPDDTTSLVSLVLHYEDADGNLAPSQVELRLIGTSVRVFGPGQTPMVLAPLIGKRLLQVLRQSGH